MTSAGANRFYTAKGPNRTLVGDHSGADGPIHALRTAIGRTGGPAQKTVGGASAAWSKRSRAASTRARFCMAHSPNALTGIANSCPSCVNWYSTFGGHFFTNAKIT